MEEFQRDLDTGNLAHAYLFAGKKHLGKLTTAHWFAYSILTKDLDKEASQKMKHDIERLTHPDLLVLDQLWIEDVCDDWDVIAKTSNIPQQHRSKTPKAKTDVISIDDIRSVQERLYETGTGKYRCCIISSVDRMKDAAANAFLKILEEPPEGLVFIITTQKLSSLLPTIISRCRVIQFSQLSNKEIKPLLEDCNEDDAQFLLHLAQGAPGIIRRLRDNPDLLREHRLIHSKAGAFWDASSLRERIQLLDPLKERGEDSDRFLLHLGLTLREKKPTKDRVDALNHLAMGLQTNAHRQLQTQEFALSIKK